MSLLDAAPVWCGRCGEALYKCTHFLAEIVLTEEEAIKRRAQYALAKQFDNTFDDTPPVYIPDEHDLRRTEQYMLRSVMDPEQARKFSARMRQRRRLMEERAALNRLERD